MNKTFENLANAFAGESQARNRYTYFASVAKKEGYEQIAAIFLETAENEKEHAEIFYKLLGHGTFKVDAEYPFFLGTTLENLKSAAQGEHDEWSHLYLESALTAQKEGFVEAENAFKQVLESEKHHEARFRKLNDVENSLVFRKLEEVQWKCRKCGRVVTSKEAPALCPTCRHERKYFEVLCELG